jgi:putative nucleotidyltransferase with HDIG domain
MNASRPQSMGFSRRVILRLGLLVLTACLSFVLLALPIAIRPSSFPLNIGDVAAQDIQSPNAVSYTSDYLTVQARTAAVDAVQPVYLPSDPAIARRQIERLHVILDYISSVRYDGFASLSQKNGDISNISDLHLSPDTIDSILLFSEARWQVIQQDALSVLEQVMRNTIRDTSVADFQRTIPSLIDYSISQDQAAVIYDLVSPYIVPNSLYSEGKTNLARKAAGDAVQPVQRSFMAGEIIVRRGQVITPVIYEALNGLGLIQPESGAQSLVAVLSLVTLSTVFVGLYLSRRKIAVINDAKSLILIAVLFIIFLTGARIVIPNRVVVPYLYPIAAFGLTVGSLYNMELGIILSLILSVLSGYNLPNSLDVTFFYLLGSLFGILILGKGRRIIHFFWSGMAIGFAGAALILAYRLPDTITDWIGIATLVGAGFLNGLASASLTLLFQFLFSQVLGLVTAMQLLDLSRPDHPLLQYLLRNAPGTYQHSLQVSNLAEQAAESIGADALLVRVGCLYHDIGKTANPSFFVENQVPGKIDSHDNIDPAVSAASIIQHVYDGVTLARRHRIPQRVIDFIREHHGTTFTRYQYTREVMNAGNRPEAVDKELFRYPGPRPRSRETALLMLADGCEARARAELPKDDEELGAVIRAVFEFLQTEGQFDDTVLTLRDLHKVQESFLASLKNTYHPRIKYPELNQSPSETMPPQAPKPKSEIPLRHPQSKARK